MRRIPAVLASIACVLLPLVSSGAEPTPKQRAARERMSACSKEAASQKLSGEARRNWMKSCLSGSTVAGGARVPGSEPVATTPPPSTPLARCTADANEKGLSGAARTSFVAACLRRPKTPEAPKTPGK